MAFGSDSFLREVLGVTALQFGGAFFNSAIPLERIWF